MQEPWGWIFFLVLNTDFFLFYENSQKQLVPSKAAHASFDVAMGFPGGSAGKNQPVMQEIWV